MYTKIIPTNFTEEPRIIRGGVTKRGKIGVDVSDYGCAHLHVQLVRTYEDQMAIIIDELGDDGFYRYRIC